MRRGDEGDEGDKEGGIVGNLATQFATAVKNCMTVNFFSKLKRVCKYEVAQAGGQ